ncbi:MAG: type II toxin-antitoxin system YafQ family toxin [Rickettsiales bacterium]|nr:type II toxin-antitoxin system YafQ family toxin [Rickettsiales bacterium]
MLTLVKTTSFKKDFKKISKQGKNLEILKQVILNVRENKKLDPKFNDHNLAGNYKDKRECHLSPDWLLVYEVKGIELVLHRTGSHSELFK